MATKIKFGTSTGSVDIYQYHGLFRVSSKLFIGPIAGYDFDEGYDEFFPDTVNDEDLGRHVRLGCDQSREIPWESVKGPLDMKLKRKKLQEWHRKAFRAANVRDLGELWDNCSFASCSRTTDFFLLINGAQKSPTNIVGMTEFFTSYWESVLKHPVSDQELGAETRVVLGKMAKD
jgi:hypothetical protein